MTNIWIFLKTIGYALGCISIITFLYLFVMALILGGAYAVGKLTGRPILNEEKENGSKSGETD